MAIKRWFPVVALLTIIAGLTAWRLSQKRAEAMAEQKAGAAQRGAPALVETAAVSRQDVVKTFEAVANVEAPLAVEISAKVPGHLLSLSVREGNRVRAGQILARIDPTEVQAAVRRERATLAGARARLAEAALTQNAQGVNVSSAVRQQQAALRTAQAQDRQARADFEAQVAAAEANVAEAEGRVAEAEADISGADAAIASARANLENARTELKRQETLLAKGFVAQQVVDNARTALKVQEAALDRTQENRRAAVAVRDSARAQQRVAERQVQIARNKADADVAAAAAAVSQAQATLDAARANTARTSAYTQNLAALRAVVAAAQANVRSAETRLADTTLRAPLTGIVTRRAIDPGALVAPNQPLLSVQAVDQVWATVSVPEEVSRRLAPGQAATVAFDALPGETFAGRIEQALPAADVQSRQFTVRVRLENRDHRIRPGMFGRVTFVVQQEKNVPVAPLEAVSAEPSAPGTGTVTVVADGKAHVRQVRTGLDNGKVIALHSGVTVGEAVIILSSRPVKDGQSVRAESGNERPQAHSDANSAGDRPRAGAARP